jgi:hypothetical protein
MMPFNIATGDRVRVVRRHPIHDLCGFQAHMLGVEGIVQGVALTTWGEPAWLVEFRHPISRRLVTAPILAHCLDRVA